MSNWTPLDTNTHQDHVVAHVLNTTPLAYFVFDETLYVLLDIGFIWNIYLDSEMGLLPHVVATNEISLVDEAKTMLKREVDSILLSTASTLHMFRSFERASPIERVDLFARNESRRLLLTCEESQIIIETSLETREVCVMEDDEPINDGLSETVREEEEFVRERLREQLGREPSQDEMDEWLREQTEGY